MVVSIFALLGVSAAIQTPGSIKIISPKDAALQVRVNTISGLSPDQLRPVHPSKSELLTYLINDGDFSNKEIEAASSSLLNTKILMVATVSIDGKWETWRPNGDCVPDAESNIPDSVKKRAKPGTMLVQTLQSHANEEQWSNLCDGKTGNGLVSFKSYFSTSYAQQAITTWSSYWMSGSEYMDIPFTLSVIDEAASLPPKIGEKTVVDGVEFAVTDIENATKDRKTSNAVTVQRKGSGSFPRFYSLSPSFDPEYLDRNGIHRFVKTFETAPISSTAEDSRRIVSSARISNWKAIDIVRTTVYCGYFGHIKTQPNR